MVPCAAASLASAILVGGCASSPSPYQITSADDASPVNSGLDALRDGGDGASASDEKPDIEQMTADFGRGLDELDALMNPPRKPNVQEAKPDVKSGPASPVPVAVAPAGGDGTTASTPSATPATPPEEMLRTVTGEAAGLLRSTFANDPYALAVRLVSLRAAGGGAVPGLDTLIKGLPVDKREAVEALADVLAGASGGVSNLEDALAARSAALDEAKPIKIARAVLCSRVEAFGRYTELGRDGFVAGRPIPMIIYTEAAHFDRAPVFGSVGGSSADEVWEVKLGQEVQLYHESDGLLAWRRPEQVTVFRSKSHLNDFFLVDQIELPRTLTVGAYRLKIVLRDLHDQSIDERIIPIRVVADQNLTAGYGG